MGLCSFNIQWAHAVCRDGWSDNLILWTSDFICGFSGVSSPSKAVREQWSKCVSILGSVVHVLRSTTRRSLWVTALVMKVAFYITLSWRNEGEDQPFVNSDVHWWFFFLQAGSDSLQDPTHSSLMLTRANCRPVSSFCSWAFKPSVLPYSCYTPSLSSVGENLHLAKSQ